MKVSGNLVPRLFLRHTLITTPNEHPVHFDQICPENGQIWKPLWISPLARQRQATEYGRGSMAVALALILQKMNREIENKDFEDLI